MVTAAALPAAAMVSLWSSTSPPATAPVGGRPPALLRRKREYVSPAVMPDGTLKLTTVEPAGTARFVAICSPESSQSLSRLKSIQASSLPAADVVTVALELPPGRRVALKTTPSSSSVPLVSSPVAFARGRPSVSASIAAPRRKEESITWQAPLADFSVG